MLSGKKSNENRPQSSGCLVAADGTMPTDIRRLVRRSFVFSATAATVCFVTGRDTGCCCCYCAQLTAAVFVFVARRIDGGGKRINPRGPCLLVAAYQQLDKSKRVDSTPCQRTSARAKIVGRAWTSPLRIC